MSRYNMFNQVHKGLRALLYETALAIQQTDFLNEEDGNEVLKQIEDVVDLFEKHAHTEDSMVLPAIAGYEPSVANVFEEEHEKDHQLAQRLKELVFVCIHSEKEETRIQTVKEISLAFVEFMVFNLNHMAKEETVINKLLWRYYSDEDLHKLTQQIVSKIAPEAMTKFSKWMIRGLNNQEIVGWLKEVKATAPDFVMNGLTATAEKELQASRWKLVYTKLIQDKAVA